LLLIVGTQIRIEIPVERSQGGVLCPLALDLVAGGGEGDLVSGEMDNLHLKLHTYILYCRYKHLHLTPIDAKHTSKCIARYPSLYSTHGGIVRRGDMLRGLGSL